MESQYGQRARMDADEMFIKRGMDRADRAGELERLHGKGNSVISPYLSAAPVPTRDEILAQAQAHSRVSAGPPAHSAGGHAQLLAAQGKLNAMSMQEARHKTAG